MENAKSKKKTALLALWCGVALVVLSSLWFPFHAPSTDASSFIRTMNSPITTFVIGWLSIAIGIYYRWYWKPKDKDVS